MSRRRKKKRLKTLHKIDRIPKAARGEDEFYQTKEWLQLRYRVLENYGRVCMACGDNKSQVHIDHIKPRSKNPSLALDFNNLQVLCWRCNIGKSNKLKKDWRPETILRKGPG